MPPSLYAREYHIVYLISDYPIAYRAGGYLQITGQGGGSYPIAIQFYVLFFHSCSIIILLENKVSYQAALATIHVPIGALFCQLPILDTAKHPRPHVLPIGDRL